MPLDVLYSAYALEARACKSPTAERHPITSLLFSVEYEGSSTVPQTFFDGSQVDGVVRRHRIEGVESGEARVHLTSSDGLLMCQLEIPPEGRRPPRLVWGITFNDDAGTPIALCMSAVVSDPYGLGVDLVTSAVNNHSQVLVEFLVPCIVAKIASGGKDSQGRDVENELSMTQNGDENKRVGELRQRSSASTEARVKTSQDRDALVSSLWRRIAKLEAEKSQRTRQAPAAPAVASRPKAGRTAPQTQQRSIPQRDPVTLATSRQPSPTPSQTRTKYSASTSRTMLTTSSTPREPRAATPTTRAVTPPKRAISPPMHFSNRASPIPDVKSMLTLNPASLARVDYLRQVGYRYTR